MGKSKFGGDKYKPHQLGPDPAAPLATSDAVTPPPVQQAAATAVQPTPPAPAKKGGVERPDALRDVKVQFTSRITYGAAQQLKTMAREGRTTTDLLAEALNLLFKKHGIDETA